MKKILLACGSGIVTSTAVRTKLEKLLDQNGYKGKYKIEQCKVSEVPNKSGMYDFCISTTQEPSGVKCPFVRGVSFLTGIGIEKTMEDVYALMDK